MYTGRAESGAVLIPYLNLWVRPCLLCMPFNCPWLLAIVLPPVVLFAGIRSEVHCTSLRESERIKLPDISTDT